MSEYQVVVSFRLDPGTTSIDTTEITEHFQRLMLPTLIRPAWKAGGLSVNIRQIGAQGETSADEGRWDRS